MADSNVDITAGSGTSIDTRTEATNGNHRQVIVIGDPSTNAGVAPVDATAGLKVNLGADNDITLATLPDTSAGDLAAINTAVSGTLTVSGTVTANLGATDNAVLDAIQAATEASQTALEIIDDWDETNRAAVNLIASQAGITGGAGAVAANTPRVTLASDDPAVALLGTIDTDTGSIATSASTIAGAVSGSEMQVDIVSGNVTNTGTFAVQVDGDALAALQLIDDAIIADDAAFTPATTKVMMSGFEYDDTTPDSVDEGDAGAARMSANRNVYMQIRDAAGNERGVNVNASNELTVVESNSTAILADTANMDTNLATIAGAVSGSEVQVDIVSGNVTNAGTFAVQVDGDALTALQLIDDAVFTDDAAFTAGTSKGMMIMGYAGAQSVNSGDAAALACTTSGELHVNINGDSSGGVEVVQDTAGDLNMTEANSAAILADTANMDTNLGTIAGAVSGSEMQVDIVSSATISTVPGITGIGNGVKTVTTAGTDEALAGSTACKRVVVQAQTDNTGWIAVGTSGVDATEATGTGVLLGAGDSFELDIDDLADVYIDSTVNGEGVRYTYFT